MALRAASGGVLTSKMIEEQMRAMKETRSMRSLDYDPFRGILGGPNHVADALRYGGMTNTKAEDTLTPERMRGMIASRMRWSPAGLHFDYLEARKLNSEQAIVFLVVGDKAVMIYDDINLFPSDTLITQLRLLENNK